MERTAALDFGGVEVSEDSIDLGPRDRVNAIKHALAVGLVVFTELGKKFPDRPLDAEEAIEMADRDFDAGAYLVVVEKSDVALAIRSGTDALHRLMRGVAPEPSYHRVRAGRRPLRDRKVAHPGIRARCESRERRCRGPYIIEGMRHGLHRATDYEYFHAYRGKTLPSVPPVK